jgi:hypothetical protein
MLGFGLTVNGRTLHVASEPLLEIGPTDQVQTIQEAVSRVRPGETIVVHGGIYREEVVIDRSGSPTQPITLRAAEGQRVILTGADHLTEWTEAPGGDGAYVTLWPHRFITWNQHYTHPHDDFHRLIGRCEQVFVNAYPMRQVLEQDRLARGTFFVDINAERLYLHPANDQDLTGSRVMVEASSRGQILSVKGDYVTIKGLRFRYAANRAQHGAVELAGNHLTVADCIFEYTNAAGAKFTGEDIVVRRCTFQHNGQLGFAAGGAHRLRLTDCTVRNNNTKGFQRGWEAGGNKIVLTRGAVFEHSRFVENRGDVIWFDIGNEDCTVRNCLIAHNENAGIFYEISYGLHAHDNVIVGNGFAHSPGDWGANSGISLSSSPYCIVERNLLIGNKEGFNFREQVRSTARIEGESEPVWNHHQTVQHNVFAFNRDAQVWGWFDIGDERHWPAALQTAARDGGTGDERTSIKNLSLASLHLNVDKNLYGPGPGHGLFHWGVTWKQHHKDQDLGTVQKELSLEKEGRVAEFHVRDDSAFDFRLPPASPAIRMNCYPRGSVPGVRLTPTR